MEVVRRVLIVAETDDGVLEAQQHPRVDVEGEVEIQRTATPLLRVEVDLPDLSQRVRLDKVPLVVHVEAMVDRMVLDLCHIAGYVDGCHGADLSGLLATGG